MLHSQVLSNGLHLRYKVVIFADDITILISPEDKDALADMACLEVGSLEEILKHMGLSIEELKTHNILYDPNILPEGIF